MIDRAIIDTLTKRAAFIGLFAFSRRQPPVRPVPDPRVRSRRSRERGLPNFGGAAGIQTLAPSPPWGFGSAFSCGLNPSRRTEPEL